MKTSAMHKSICSAMLLAIGFLILAASAVAQQKTYTIKVPFEFRAAARALPAGVYHVGEVSAETGTVSLRGVNNGATAFVVTSAIASRESGKLPGRMVFHRYGNHYFLAEVWWEGSPTGNKVPTSRAELEYAKLDRRVDTKLLASTK